MTQHKRHKSRHKARKTGRRQRPYLHEHDAMARQAQSRIGTAERRAWGAGDAVENFNPQGATVTPA